MISEQLAGYIEQQVSSALAEDIGSGDISAGLIEVQKQSKAHIVCRQPAVICGIPWVERCFKLVDQQIVVDWQVKEGDQVAADSILCFIVGPARGVLSAERTALNFLQTLSATATLTRRYVEKIDRSETKLLDTRKTIPGWRLAQKYATRVGGAHNHRMGLYDAFLIKENHINALGSIAAAVNAAKNMQSAQSVEIEVENLDQLQQALEAGADCVLLDNFSIQMLEQAVKITAGRCLLEASGGISLDNINRIAATGVDRISVGAITKNIDAIDLSLRFEFTNS